MNCPFWLFRHPAAVLSHKNAVDSSRVGVDGTSSLHLAAAEEVLDGVLSGGFHLDPGAAQLFSLAKWGDIHSWIFNGGNRTNIH